IEEVPGVVVLHDFFLSSLYAWLEWTGTQDGAWVRALHHSHGYHAVRDRLRDDQGAKMRYPANLDVLQSARGVVVHSQYARSLGEDWFGADFTADWTVVPLARALRSLPDRAEANHGVSLADDAFVVC